MAMEIPVTEARERMAAVVEEAVTRPVYLSKRGRRVAVVISAEEYERLLDAAEEAEDIADGETALARIRAGEPTIPWEQVKADLGL
jgi:prevent-host-death family protein